MPPASFNLTLCSRCKYPIELAIAPDTQATCPECGTLNTGAEHLRRLGRRNARRFAHNVVVAFLGGHATVLTLLFSFGRPIQRLTQVPLSVQMVIAVIATALSAVAAGIAAFRSAGQFRDDVARPVFFGIYLPCHLVGIGYIVVLFLLDSLSP